MVLLEYFSPQGPISSRHWISAGPYIILAYIPLRFGHCQWRLFFISARLFCPNTIISSNIKTKTLLRTGFIVRKMPSFFFLRRVLAWHKQTGHSFCFPHFPNWVNHKVNSKTTTALYKWCPKGWWDGQNLSISISKILLLPSFLESHIQYLLRACWAVRWKALHPLSELLRRVFITFPFLTQGAGQRELGLLTCPGWSECMFMTSCVIKILKYMEATSSTKACIHRKMGLPSAQWYFFREIFINQMLQV